MTRFFTLFLILSAGIVSAQEDQFQPKFSVEELKTAPVKLIPFPQEVEWGEGMVPFNAIELNSEDLSPVIQSELKEVLLEAGIGLEKNADNHIRFIENEDLGEEAYKLRVSRGSIDIEASGEAGQFYALQTLRQLAKKKGSVQLATINDYPAFGLRGYMVDVGRNFQSMEALKEQLDIMARYKYNTFHWHLTDYPAWRIESKAYPELTAAENHRPTRDPGMFYTYDEIRELIRYSDSLQIQVIPEIDMPGHSDAFTKAVGHKMESPEGMKILEEVLAEFFEEIPKEMAPMIHIGSDEVEIPNPEEFMNRMVSFIQDRGREVIIWNPGLPVNDRVIRQTWKPMDTRDIGAREIDSWNSYINNGEPMIHIPKLFFKPIGGKRENEVLGGIIALWEDVNIDREEQIIEHNPLYPSLLTYAWTTWTADVQQDTREFITKVPPKGSLENEYFAAFEDFLMYHKEKYFQGKPFQYSRQANTVWRLAGPFGENSTKEDLSRDEVSWKEATGNTVYIRDRFKQGGQYPEAKPGEVYYAVTNIHSDQTREVPFWVGFETPYRPNRTHSGIPEQGEWDVNGGNIWINGIALPAPKWENPGWRPERPKGWGSPSDQELPWTDEELYWTRGPVMVKLNKGWNKVIIKVPGTSTYQNWMYTFAPLKSEGLRFSTTGSGQ